MPTEAIKWADAYTTWGLTIRSLEKAYSPSRLLDVLAAYLPSGSSANVLELGCAPGRWLAWAMKTLSIAAVGVELDVVGARLSHELYPGLRITRADAQLLPFADGSFDAVFSLGLIEHFDNPTPILQETRRVLRPGGITICSVPNLEPRSFCRWHWERFQPKVFAAHRPYTLSELCETFSMAGFKVIHAEANGLYVPHLQRVLGRLPFRRLLRRFETHGSAASLVT